MVVNRIHAGPVVFARILAASVAPYRVRTAQPTRPSDSAGRNPQAIHRRNHVVERFHQWKLYSALRGSF